MATIKTNCAIIGGGPAGYTAAIYASRANLAPLLIEGMQPGGQLTTTTEVENFPGYPEGISGPQMMEDIRLQAQRFGADIRLGVVTSVDFSKQPYTINLDNSEVIEAKNSDYRHRSQCPLSRTARRTTLHGYGRLGMCHMRRILLP